jgi:hypothetical protein
MKGNLVYVPSKTVLMHYSDHPDGAPSEIRSLEEPHYLLVRNELENKLSVLYEGKIWLVEKRKVINNEI